MKTNQAGSSSFEQLASFSNAILSEVEKAVVGKRDTLCKILTALLSAGGHILLEDYPGMAKTLIAKSFATALGLEFKRIQFTPDLLPGDIIATQNPIEYEGTFPLPEAQLDRFLVKVAIGYPGPDDEQEILNRRLKRKQDQIILNSAVNLDIFLEMRKKVEGVYVHPDVQRYIIDTVTKTRGHRQVSIGVSPRGSLALLKLARAWAAFNGRDYVLPDDVKVFAHCALGHRIILEPNLWGKRNAEEAVIDEVVQSVSVPLVVVNHEA
jgi:MoxR-like ATPase